MEERKGQSFATSSRYLFAITLSIISLIILWEGGLCKERERERWENCENRAEMVNEAWFLLRSRVFFSLPSSSSETTFDASPPPSRKKTLRLQRFTRFLYAQRVLERRFAVEWKAGKVAIWNKSCHESIAHELAVNRNVPSRFLVSFFRPETFNLRFKQDRIIPFNRLYRPNENANPDLIAILILF